MKQMGICKRVKWLAMNQPLTLPSIINDSRFDKRIFIGILHDLIPRRTSIEIECIGRLTNFKQPGKEKHVYKLCADTTSYPELARKYNIHSLLIDDQHAGFRVTDYDEHNISIINYTQIIGLYNILQDMQKFCSLNTASGCHIHLDLHKTMKLPNYSHNEIATFFTNKCNNGTIESIFGKYPEGGMMWIKACGNNHKGNWITTRKDYKSLEFRTAPMTFDYSTIIKWFIAVNKLLNEFEHTLINKEQTTESPNDCEVSAASDAW